MALNGLDPATCPDVKPRATPSLTTFSSQALFAVRMLICVGADVAGQTPLDGFARAD